MSSCQFGHFICLLGTHWDVYNTETADHKRSKAKLADYESRETM